MEEQKKEKKKNGRNFYGFLLEIIDNDTLIIGGLITVALIYIFKDATSAKDIIENIVCILGGGLGANAINKKVKGE